MNIDPSTSKTARSSSLPSRDQLEAKIAGLEKQRAELLAERETLQAEILNQSQWLQKSWRKLETERRMAASGSQPKPTKPQTIPQEPNPIPPANQQPIELSAQEPNPTAIQQFQKLQQGVRR